MFECLHNHHMVPTYSFGKQCIHFQAKGKGYLYIQRVPTCYMVKRVGRFASCCLRTKHKYHNKIYVLQGGILSDYLIVVYVWLIDLKKNKIWYEGWKVLDIFADLLVHLGSLTWEYLDLSLAGIWALNLVLQLAWWWEHLLDIHLVIQLTCCLDTHLVIPLTHGKDFLLEFHLHTVWLDDWHWRSIFCWLITSTSTWIPTWMSKVWSWAAWNAVGNAS